MVLTIVIGAQFGSEGKGKIAAHLALNHDVSLAVRCGSTNSGHTVWHRDKCYPLRMIPTGFITPDVDLAIAAGAIVDPRVLKHESIETGVEKERLFVDRNAMVIEEADLKAERTVLLGERIGSTQSGVGQAVARRVLRGADARLIRDVPEVTDFASVIDVSELVRRRLDAGSHVVIEGTQGYGLSLYHTPAYPYATSRDTTAAAFLSEVGVGPRAVTDVILAVRTYPIESRPVRPIWVERVDLGRDHEAIGEP